MIPKIFFQFWDTDQVPTMIQENIEHNKKMHPDHEFRLITDRTMINFLRDNYPRKVLNSYRDNKIPASRADMARIFMIYHYGGIYLDASWKCNCKLDEYLKSQDPKADVFLVRRDEGKWLLNGLMAAPKKHPLIKSVLDEIIHNTTNRLHNFNVTKCTGTGPINNAYKKYPLKKKVHDKLHWEQLKRDKIILRNAHKQKTAWLKQEKRGIY